MRGALGRITIVAVTALAGCRPSSRSGEPREASAPAVSVEGLSETKQVTEVQLAPKDDGKDLRRLLNKRVRIRGTAFPEHTAWHVRPVLVDVDSVSAL